VSGTFQIPSNSTNHRCSKRTRIAYMNSTPVASPLKVRRRAQRDDGRFAYVRDDAICARHANDLAPVRAWVRFST
jgi:hypothetical protein